MIHQVWRPKMGVQRINVGASCNKCGKMADLDEGRLHYPQMLPPDMHRITVEGGYADEYPGDGCSLHAVICSDCLRSWAATFTDPDVIHDRAAPRAVRAWHTECECDVIVEAGWVYPTDQTCPQGPAPDVDEIRIAQMKQGVWRHYRNRQLYQVIGGAVGCASLEGVELILYRGLYGESAVFVRPAAQWTEQVAVGDIMVTLDTVPRFAQVV